MERSLRKPLMLAGGLAASAVGALALGRWRWRLRSAELRRRLQAIEPPKGDLRYDRRCLESVPAPVARYLSRVLPDGHGLILRARLVQEGAFRMGENPRSWRSFRAHQLVTTMPPGFDWDAAVRLVPGVSAFVHDAYVEGRGLLHAELLGLFPLVDQTTSPLMAEAELQRFLAEAPWYPTALLPRPLRADAEPGEEAASGLHWEAVDASAARAILVDGANRAELEFHFGADGLVTGVRAETRYRGERDGIAQLAPWSGRFRRYQRRHGLLIPMRASVRWELPEGELTYYRGRLLDIEYELAV